MLRGCGVRADTFMFLMDFKIGEPGAMGGGLHVAGFSLVDLEATTVSGCWAERWVSAIEPGANQSAIQGGGIFMASGSVLLLQGSELLGNDAPIGRSVWVTSGTITYALPAKPGHWIAAQRCTVYYKACPFAEPNCVRKAQVSLHSQYHSHIGVPPRFCRRQLQSHRGCCADAQVERRPATHVPQGTAGKRSGHAARPSV